VGHSELKIAERGRKKENFVFAPKRRRHVGIKAGGQLMRERGRLEMENVELRTA